MSQRTTTRRRVNRSNRAKLNSKGFKVYKNFKLYIAEATEGGWSRSGKPAPRKELVDMVRQMWNNDPSIKAMRKHIKEISIKYVKTINITGMWNNEKKKVTVNDNGIESVDEYGSTFVHEIIGHTFWDFARKWRREELIAFNKLANELPPVSTYVKKNEEEWKKMNDENDDFVQFEKSISHIPEWDASEELCNEYESKRKAFEENRKTNGHDTMTRYANEQHSAISEIVYGIGGHTVLLQDSDVQRLVDLWKELHY